MERRFGDSTRALVAALILLASAAFILFSFIPEDLRGRLDGSWR